MSRHGPLPTPVMTASVSATNAHTEQKNRKKIPVVFEEEEEPVECRGVSGGGQAPVRERRRHGNTHGRQSLWNGHKGQSEWLEHSGLPTKLIWMYSSEKHNRWSRVRVYHEINYTGRTLDDEDRLWKKCADLESQRTALCRTTRVCRDLLQQRVAAERAKLARKSEPKMLREQRIKSQRDKRVPVIFSDDIEPNAGRIVAGATLAGAGIVLSSLCKLIRKVTRTHDQATGAVSGFAQGISGFVQNLKKKIEHLRKKMSHPLFIVLAVSVLSYYIIKIVRKGSFPQRVLLLTLTSLCGPALWGLIAKHFLHCDKALSELGVSDNALEHDDVSAQIGVNSFTAIIASAMCFSAFGSGVTQRTIGETIKRVSLLERTSSGLEVFCNWTISAVEAVLSVFARMFGRPAVKLRRETDVRLKDWCRDVESTEKTWNLNEREIDAQELDKLMALCVRGTELKEMYRWRPNLFAVVNALMIRLYALFSPYQGSISARNNFRIEPEMVLFTGAPGIGKTMLMMPICAYLLMASGALPPGSEYSDVLKNVWQKGVSEYWNGYAGQKAVVLDDAFQQRPSIGDKDNEYINVIKMVTSWAMPLNFADLASKGKIYFNSPLIVGTTNLTNLATPCEQVVFTASAVIRRISSPYSITISPGFATAEGTLDYSKYQQEVDKCKGKPGIEGFPFHVWECKRHDYMRGVSESAVLPLKEVLLAIASRLKGRILSQANAVSNLQGFIGGFATNAPPSTGSVPEIEAQAGINDAFGHLPIHTEDAGFTPLFQPYVLHTQASAFAQVAALVDEERKEDEVEQGKYRRWFSKICHLVGTYGIPLAAGFLAIKLVSAVVSAFVDFLSPEDKKHRDKLLSQSNRPLGESSKVSGVKHRLVSSIKPQGGNDPIAAKVYSNTMKATLLLGESVSVIGQIIFITGDLAMMPAHYRDRLRSAGDEGADADTNIKFTHSVNSGMNLVMPLRRFLELPGYTVPGSDLEFVRMGLINAHKNIIKNFLTEADLRYVSGMIMRLDVMEVDDRDKIIPQPRHAINTAKGTLGGVLRYDGYCLERHVAYPASTCAGDCGAPLSLNDAPSFGGRKTLGVHVAGTRARNEGYAVIVTQEMLQDAVSRLGAVIDNSREDIEVQMGGAVRDVDALPSGFSGSFLPLYELDRKLEQPTRSKLEPTPIRGCFGPHPYVPAVLRPVLRNGEVVHPMVNATKVYSGPLRCLDKDLVEQALHVAMKPHARETAGAPRHIFTFDEAVLGISHLKFRSVPRGTSAGFPHSYDLRGGKTHFFGNDEQGYDLDTPAAQQLRKDVDEVIDKARGGIRLAHVFIDLLKDELRKVSKVDAVATRLISSSPLRYTLAFRMYFGAFCAASMMHHTVTGMAPGINVYQDWHKLAQLLESKGPAVFAGDIKALDASELPDLHLAILDYVNRWYNDGPDNARIRSVLWMELYHSRHLGGDGTDQRYIYQWNKSLPSGHPMTTIVNSIYTLTAMVACYIKATGDLSDFWHHVYTVVYGDDNVSNVRPGASLSFNQAEVAKHMAEHFSITYTSDDKEAELGNVTDISHVTFLKRTFRLDACGMYDAALDPHSFLYSCYWSKNKKERDKIIVDELENALCELSLHEPAAWTQWAPLIDRVLTDYNGPHSTKVALTRNAYRGVVAQRSDAWF